MRATPAALLLLLALPLAAQEDGPVRAPVLLPGPGAYAAPLSVSLGPAWGSTVRYRFADAPTAETFPLTGPLILDALEGETRDTVVRLTAQRPSGESLTQDYSYRVVKPVVSFPTISPAPGYYTAPQALQVRLPAGWSLFRGDQPVSPELALDGPPGERVAWTVQARGPAGRVVDWSYVLDRRDQETFALEILGPVPGVWANAQELVVAARGADRVLWSYGAQWDPGAARPYAGPVLLDRPGAQSVSVAARSRLDGAWTVRTVSWTNGSGPAPDPVWPASGAVTGSLDLPALSDAELSWDEGRTWTTGPAARRETAAPVGRKVLAALVRRQGQVSRYLWWFDARTPAAPTLEFFGGWNPRVAFSGSPETLHTMVWTAADGHSVAEPEQLWGPSGSWKVPDGMVGARVTAVSAAGVATPAAALGFAETGWSTPGWEALGPAGPGGSSSPSLGGRIPPRAGFTPVYEVSSLPDVTEPGPRSPWLAGAFLPSVPPGADRTFYARFAWRDASGLTGPSSPVRTVRVDRLPPAAPQVVQAAGQVLLQPAPGEEEGGQVLWAVTRDRVARAEGLTFQPYLGPLDAAALRAGAGGGLWVHAVARDPAGNTGAVRLNVAVSSGSAEANLHVVQVDPDPVVGELTVEEGGVYAWPQFRLRPVDPGRDLWVGVTDQDKIPADWKTRLQPWDGLLSRSVGRGERKTFQIFWNRRSGDSWAWPEPQRLSLTLDLGPPAAPRLTTAWPSGALAGPWTLSAAPGRAGDSLRYTFTLDGATPADPAEAGDFWPGTRTWDCPPGARREVRLRLEAVSAAGLTVEVPLPGPVILDRTVPPLVSPGLEPFTYRAEALTIPAPAGVADLRYSLTDDGTLPAPPGPDAARVPAPGLVLPGQEGRAVLYRIVWRAFSESGLPGPASEAVSVLVDRSAARGAATAAGPAPVRQPAPVLYGLDPRGVSNQPQRLSALPGPGDLRYEVREGLGPTPPVTPRSPLWPGVVTLDPGEGNDRTYTLALRRYASDGSPLSDEVQTSMRIDRQAPPAPSVRLVAETRRPEGILRAETAPEGDVSLMYRWLWTSFPAGQGTSPWEAAPPALPPRFAAPGGALTRLTVQTYYRDEAGNAGPTSEATLLVDQNVVYCRSGGTDSGDGSRGRPWTSLEEAVTRAHREGRGIVFCAEGGYTLRRTVDLGGLQVYGGWTAGDWETTRVPSRSVWGPAEGFEGASLVESGAEAWSLSQIDLSSGALRLAAVVLVRGADVRVRDANLSWARVDAGWDQQGGRLAWSNVAATYAAEPQGTFLRLSGVEASLSGLSVSATLNQDGVLFRTADARVLARDLTVVSKRGGGFETLWSGTGGNLTVDGGRFLIGDGAARSAGFVLRGVEAALFNVDLGLYAAAANTGIQASGGRLDVQKTRLSVLAGTEFNQGFVLDHNPLDARSLAVRLAGGSYQSAFTVDGESLALDSCTIEVAGGGLKAWGAQFLSPVRVQQSDVTWTLLTRTPGELWRLVAPWSMGSQQTRTVHNGW